MRFISKLLTAGSLVAGMASVGFAKGDDVDFARALVREGYVDLANEFCDRLLNDSGTSADDKAGVQLIQAEISAKMASQQEDPADMMKLLDKAVEQLESFIKANTGHPRVVEAKFQIGMLLRQKGDICTALLRKEQVAEKKTQLRDDGDKNFKRAEDYFTALTAEYQKMKDEWVQRTNGRTPTAQENQEFDDITFNLMDSVYNVPRTYYSHCLIFESGSKEKNDLTDKAIAAFMDFELDYGDRMRAYESSIFWALTLKELSKFEDANKRYDFSISLKEYFASGNGVYNFPDDARDIILTAFYYKAQGYNDQKDYQGAIKCIDEMLKLVKNSDQDRMGISAQLVQGDAYVGMGNQERAVEIGKKLLKTAPTEGLKGLIKNRIAEWAMGGKGAEGSNISTWLIIAESYLDQGKFLQALAAYQKGIAACEAASQQEQIPDLLWKMAKIYDQELNRPYETVQLYDQIAHNYPKSKIAPQAAFGAAHVWNKLAVNLEGEKGTYEKDQKEAALRYLTATWPNDPSAKNVQMLVAEGYYEKKDFVKAAEEYSKVSEDAPGYEQAQAMSAQCYLELGKSKWSGGDKSAETVKLFEKAEVSLKKCLESIKKGPPKDPTALKNRPQVEAFVRTSLVSLYLHESKKQYQLALDTIKEIEDSNPGDDVRKKLFSQKVSAYLAMNKLPEAIEATEVLFKEFKSSKPAMEACHQVGIACDAAAEALAGVKEGEQPDPAKVTDEALKLWEQAAKYYANWIRVAIEIRSTLDSKDRIKPEDAVAIADRIYGLGTVVNKIDDKQSFTSIDLNALRRGEIFGFAAAIYEPISNEELGRVPNSGTLLLKLAYCYDFAQKWPEARDAYERLIESERLRNPQVKGTINAAVLKAQPRLFSAYAELGHVYLRLAEANNNRAGSLQEAFVIFANVVDKSDKDSEGWWKAKYYCIKILFDKGQQGDYEQAKMGILDMRKNYPNFDEDKFKMKKSYEDLEKAIGEKAPKK